MKVAHPSWMGESAQRTLLFTFLHSSMRGPKRREGEMGSELHQNLYEIRSPASQAKQQNLSLSSQKVLER
jgi:hypothetical protein